MELLRRKYVVVDMEGIVLNKDRKFWKGRFSRRHYCLRKICFEFWDISKKSMEFDPCVRWVDLDYETEKRSDRSLIVEDIFMA